MQMTFRNFYTGEFRGGGPSAPFDNFCDQIFKILQNYRKISFSLLFNNLMVCQVQQEQLKKGLKTSKKPKASGPALIGPTGALKAALRPRPFGPPFQQILDPPLFEYTGNRVFFHADSKSIITKDFQKSVLTKKMSLITQTS